MKKFLAIITAFMTVFSLCTFSFAAEDTPNEKFKVIVSDKTLDLSSLPLSSYKDGETFMVPLREIGEALGYKVGWDSETKAITIDDNYIQKATLFNGNAAAVFEGRLEIINMSRKIENAAPTAILNGYTYVPLEFFQEFLNDTAVTGNTITIAPSKCEINTDN